MKDKLVPWRKRSVQQNPDWGANPFDTLLREVNDLFDTYRDNCGAGLRRVASAGWELSETDDEIRVKAELPGMDKKDVHVSVDGDVLTIRGEHKEEKETKKRSYHVSEMSCGGYSRSIPLPAEVDATQAEAKFKHGVLTLNLPKTERGKAATKRIKVRED